MPSIESNQLLLAAAAAAEDKKAEDLRILALDPAELVLGHECSPIVTRQPCARRTRLARDD